MSESRVTAAAEKSTPIAVVGVSALFPGALTTASFWQDILAGRDRLTDVPRTHWLAGDYFDPRPGTPDKVCTTRGGFLSGVDFDPLEFGLPPNIAQATDTAQLLSLIVAKRALAEATRGRFESIDRSRISVVLGVASATELVAHMSGRLQIPVAQRAMRAAGLDEADIARVSEVLAGCYVPWQESTFPGLLGNVVAGRIANRLDLGGTNTVVDAACASSLAAVDIAANELALGRADLVLTGGVDTLNDILMFMCFAQTGALSPTGDCRPFSDDSDGTMLGEGIGIVALKRLEDAERDGDAIYAVIRGVGTSSDGRSKSIYAPAPEGQARALERAYARAGYGPETVELVEAHGTSTKAGDAAEVQALKAVFGAAGAPPERCALGSVKAQIGHTKAAAGSAGLIKTVMALHHKVLPRTIKVRAPNPNLGLAGSPFYLNTETRPWIRAAGQPRRASVSALGFGGTNFHVAVEEYRGPAPRPPRFRTCPSELVVLAGESGATLAARCRTLAKEAASLVHLAKRSQHDFDAAAPARLSIVATDLGDLREKLTFAAEALERSCAAPFSSPRGIHFGIGAAAGPVALVFPGQGSHYVGMGRDLAVHFECVRAEWDRAAAVDTGCDTRLPDVVFPPPAWGEAAKAEQEQRLTATEWAQPAIAATSLAMLRVLERLGVAPICAAGHSLGEVTALGAFAAIDRDATIAVARRRGELVARAASEPGAMTAVTADRAKVEALVGPLGLEVVLANHNAPNQVVLSGPVAAIEEVERHLRDAGLDARRIPVSTAFHSPLVAGACAPLREHLAGVATGAARVPVYSNRSAAPYPADGERVRDEIAAAVAEPVRFVEQTEAMYAAGARVFVEVGPNSVLTKLVDRILGERPHLAVALDARGKDGVSALWDALGRLSAAGVPLAFAALWEGDALPADPATATKPKLTLRLTGANYGKPYPPAAGELPPPPRTPRAAPKQNDASAPGPAAQPAAPAPLATPIAAPIAAPLAAPIAAPLAAPPAAMPSPTPSLPPAPPSLHASVIAVQMEYQRLMAESHIAFLRAIAGTTDGACASHAAPMPMPMPMPMATALAPTPMPMPAPDLVTMPMPAPIPTAPAPVAAAPVHTPAPAASTHAPSVDLVALMLAVVADKTGYPAEMVELRMDLEADLGIDSIKRVEILSAVRERAPGLPEVDTAKMARMRTLQEIVDFFGGGQTTLAASPAAASPAAASTHAPPVDLVALMLAVVADKTGYPAEMVDLRMDLEADLGIDSIKRVEILSAVRERAPGLPEVDTAKMARMRTLQEIVDYFGGGQPPLAASPAAASPAAASTLAPPVDLVALMLAVVADKTGYPAEMVELRMDLEADLGIDSIKRVEILSAVRERAPGLPEVDTAKMARMRTLQEIVDFFGGGQTTLAASPAAASTHAPPVDLATPAARKQAAAVGRFVARTIAAPRSGLAVHGLFGPGGVVVTSDGGGVDTALIEQLRARGIAAREATIVPADAGAVIFLGGLAPVTTAEGALAVNREAFAAARTVAERFRNAGGAFITVQDTGGDFGLSGRAGDRAWLAGLGALAKTAAEEWPNATARAIDIDRGGRDAATLAAAIVDELLHGGPELEVGIDRAGARSAIVTVAAPPLAPGRSIPAGAVFVASGGARGVTAASLLELAREARPRLLLLGRTLLEEEPADFHGVVGDAALKRAALAEATRRGTPATPKEVARRVNTITAGREIRETLRAIAAVGGEARYAAVDVRDRAALDAVLDEVRRAWGPIEGIVHGAGILSDARLENKTDAQFDAVWETKVTGLRALLEATRSDPIAWLCLFSSVAARAGNAGQADYAMANEVLNKVAAVEARRRGSACRVVSIGWGPWEGGMVTPALRAHFESRGVPLLGVQDGARAFVRELTGAGEVEVGIGGDPALGLRGRPRRLQADVLVDEASWPQLASHRIKGNVVLPMAVALEWFARLARSEHRDESTFQFRDLRVVRGVPLTRFAETVGDRFHVIATPAERGRTIALELRDARGDLRYAATLDREPAPPPRAPNPDLQLAASPWTAQELYGPATLFHGPHFQVLRSVDGISSTHARATVASTRDAGWPADEWQAEPAALDGALQLAILFGLHAGAGPTLPMRIERVVYRSGHEPGPLRCELTGRGLTRERLLCDVALADARGARFLDLHGVEMFAVPSGTTAG